MMDEIEEVACICYAIGSTVVDEYNKVSLSRAYETDEFKMFLGFYIINFYM